MKQLKFINQDEFGRNVYLDKMGVRYCIVDGVMHIASRDGEPECPTKAEYRIVSRFEKDPVQKLKWEPNNG